MHFIFELKNEVYQEAALIQIYRKWKWTNPYSTPHTASLGAEKHHLSAALGLLMSIVEFLCPCSQASGSWPFGRGR
jgi:hypothetical protein